MLFSLLFFLNNAFAFQKSDIVGVWGDVGTCSASSGTYQLYDIYGNYKIVTMKGNSVTTDVDTNWWIVNSDRIVYGSGSSNVAGVLMVSSINSKYMEGIMVYADDSMQEVIFEKCQLK
jgi:hypothetical protein